MKKLLIATILFLLSCSVTLAIEGGGSGTGGGGAIETQDESITVNATTTILDFLGAGVTCVDSGGGKTSCTIPGGGGGNDYRGIVLVTDTVTPTPLTEAQSGFIAASFATPVTAVLPAAPTNGTWYTLIAGNGTEFTVTSAQPMVFPAGSDLGGLTSITLSNGQSATATYLSAGPLWLVFPESLSSRWTVNSGPYQMGEVVHPEASPPFTWYKARRAVPIGTDPTVITNVDYWIRLESPSYSSDVATPEVLAATATTTAIASKMRTGQSATAFSYTPSAALGAASDTDYVTISLDFYPSGGGGSSNIASMNSTTTGQLGAAPARIPITFATGGDYAATEPGTLILTVTQTGAGLLLPAGAFSVVILDQVLP